MIPSLEELRKSLLLAAPELAPDPAALRKRRLFTAAPPLSGRSQVLRQSGAVPVEDAGADSQQAAKVELADAPISRAVEEVEPAEPQPDDDLVEAVAAVFDSAGGYREHLARLADASESIRRLSREADKVLGPLKSFRDQMEQLLRSYELDPAIEPVGAFRRGFETLARLARRGERVEATFGGHLFELSRSLEAARTLHARMLKLAEMFHMAGALQAQLCELSQVFDGDHASKPGDTGKVESDTDNQI